MVTGLPAMLADLRASADAAGLVSTGYAMFFGGLLMFGARLGDRCGHRRVILVGLAIFAMAAVLGATAASVVMLTAARCLQGAAAALSVPSALRLLATITSDGPQRERAIAAWSASGAAAGASGFVVGGTATYLVGWRAVFWVCLPLAVLLAVAIGRAVPPDRAAERSVRLSVPSVSTFTVAVMAFVVATTVLPQPGERALGVALLGAGAVVTGAFIVIDRRSTAPLLPGAILGERSLRQLVSTPGEHGLTARLLPFTVDGLIWAASMVVLDASRRNERVPPLAAQSLGVGIVATVGANLAHGLGHGRVGALVSRRNQCRRWVISRTTACLTPSPATPPTCVNAWRTV